MTVKLSGSGTSGLAHPMGLRTRDSDMAVWSVSGGAFEAYNASNIGNYGIAATEIGATGIYSFTDPADTAPGRFRLIAGAGASLVVSDLANNTFWEDAAGASAPSAAIIVAAWQALTLSNSKTYAQAMEFIAAMVGGGKASGAALGGTQIYVVRNLADGANLASIVNDGIGNRTTVSW